MKVWALWRGSTENMRLIDLYESYDDAQREKDAIMDEQGRREKPDACTVVRMETIPPRDDYIHTLPSQREGR